MERKIGEIFEHEGEWYQCLPETHLCYGCAFKNKKCTDIKGVRGECQSASRKEDGVIFKKLEKVGEAVIRQKRPKDVPFGYWFPYAEFQRYKVSHPFILPKEPFTHYNNNDKILYIEIKQNKEIMEENNTKHSNSESIGKNLKPFDLEAAKAGKPVCTRDGRKARIICFDAEGNKPLIVLSKINGQEVILRYTEKGQSDNFHSPTPREDDLMMLPEKKEGWVNVYKGGLLDTKSYPTKKEAFDKACPEGYVDTIKINWSE